MGSDSKEFKAPAGAKDGQRQYVLSPLRGLIPCYANFRVFGILCCLPIMPSFKEIAARSQAGRGTLKKLLPVRHSFSLVTLPEELRFVGLPSAVAANLRRIIYGSLLVIMMMFRPRGLVGKYSFNK